MLGDEMKKMGWGEYPAKEIYKEEGYDVIHLHGVIDLLLLKDGKIEFVEIKAMRDRLNKNQKEAIKTLKKHGVDVRVERVTLRASEEYKGCQEVRLRRNPRRTKKILWPDHLIFQKDDVQ